MHQIFQSLAKKGYLKPREHIRALICPQCGSPHVYSKYTCPRCQSIEINRMRLIEHPFCGYTGFTDKFTSGSHLVCPNCQTDLSPALGMPRGDGSKQDYKIIGSSFECEDCGHRFDRPNNQNSCQECGLTFDYKSARYEKLYSYEIPEDVIKKLRVTDVIQVLVVEDNPDDAEIVKINFREAGESFNVVYVSEGRSGLEKVKESYYDIILLDYNLPDMKGVDFLREVKRMGIDTPVIVFTGSDDRETAVAAMKQGAADYIVKSVEQYKRLPSIVRRIVKK
jgi:CheY-like chemotaxis protein